MIDPTKKGHIDDIIVGHCANRLGHTYQYLENKEYMCGCSLRCQYQEWKETSLKPYCSIADEIRSMAERVPEDKRE